MHIERLKGEIGGKVYNAVSPRIGEEFEFDPVFIWGNPRGAFEQNLAKAKLLKYRGVRAIEIKRRASRRAIPRTRGMKASLNTREVKLRRRKGESVSDLAKRYGVSLPAIYYHLRK